MFFILNALHVVKAAPLPYDGVLQRKHERFLQLGLKGFKEYSKTYPPQTVYSWLCRDGSPSFSLILKTTAISTLAILASERLLKVLMPSGDQRPAPTRNGIWQQRIGIKHARIIGLERLHYLKANYISRLPHKKLIIPIQPINYERIICVTGAIDRRSSQGTLPIEQIVRNSYQTEHFLLLENEAGALQFLSLASASGMRVIS
jgi:hypothetical protein